MQRAEINFTLLPALIEQAGFKSQSDFIRKLDIPQSTFSGYLTGRRSPDALMLSRICSVLQVPEEVLLMPSDLLFYQGQVVAMLRWSVSQINGTAPIPTHAEADVIARRLEMSAGDAEDSEDPTVREETSPV